VFDKIVENKGNVSKSMREVGYSPATAKNPKMLLNSTGFMELLQQDVPDWLLTKKLKQLVNKKETVVKNNMTTGEIDVIPTGEIDTQAVRAGLDMAFKLKGSYAPEKKLSINANISAKENPKLKEISDEYKEKLKEALNKSNE